MTLIKVCKNCIVDSTVPGAGMENDICNYCDLHFKLDKKFPLNQEGEKKLSRMIRKIKRHGQNKKFDCIVGVSGGCDSTYALYQAVQFGLRPLAVHFNDGFGNPVAGENMKKVTDQLNVPLKTVSSDWRESKDLKIAFLKSSTPDLEQGTDIGLETALLGSAVREGIRYILSGFSFRTEGIMPLEWNYLDGLYLKNVHKKFGTYPLRRWRPEDPGFNLRLSHLVYYTFFKRIRIIPLLCFLNYNRKEASRIVEKELGWVYPGAKYYDDLYQSLMTYIYRVKFNMDRRKINYSALVRSGQMDRAQALKSIESTYRIEDWEIIKLCLKRLGISEEELKWYLKEPPKTFRDYKSSYNLIKRFKFPIQVLSMLHIIPSIMYDKYFKCG